MFSVQRCHIFCVFPNIDVLQPSQDQNVISCQKASKSVSKWPRYLTKTAKNDVFRAAFPHFLRFPKYCCFRTIPGPKGNFVPKGVPVGFEMAEKNAYKHTHRQTHTHTLAALVVQIRLLFMKSKPKVKTTYAFIRFFLRFQNRFLHFLRFLTVILGCF